MRLIDEGNGYFSFGSGIFFGVFLLKGCISWIDEVNIHGINAFS